MRTIVDLPPDQIRGLDLWCKRDRISRAEAVRRAIHDALATRRADPRAEAFGSWAGKKLDSRKFVESIRRSEWSQ